MKALTIIQPFAALIACGEKRVENRTWATSYRGPLLIHAGKAKRYGGERVKDLAAWEGVLASDLVFGAIVATAELVDCVQLVRNSSDDWRDKPWTMPEVAAVRHPWMGKHRHAEGPVCWVLANVRRLSCPIPCNGEQGLWTPKPDVLGQLREVA